MCIKLVNLPRVCVAPSLAQRGNNEPSHLTRKVSFSRTRLFAPLQCRLDECVVNLSAVTLRNLMPKIICLSVALFTAVTASAQDFGLDSFALDLGGGTSSGGTFAVSGAIIQPQADAMTGGGFSVTGEFLRLVVAAASGVTSTTLFDNLGGPNSGFEYAAPNNWLANKLCLGPESFTLDSISLFLSTRDPGNPPVARLQIYSDDPATGRPVASVGPPMNLFGESNPIKFTVVGSSFARLVKWTPATPFTLAPNRCYWAVFSVENGEVIAFPSGVIPTGPAAAFGRSQSSNLGLTWQSADHESNRKMLIQGTAATPSEPLELKITALEMTGNEVSLSFTGVTTRTYAMQSRPDLSAGQWSDVPGTAISSNGDLLRFKFLKLSTDSQQFYRVLQLR